MRTIRINPAYEHLRTFIGQLPDRMDSDGVYIYGGRRNLIKRFEAPDGTPLNVKRYKIPSFPSNICYSTGWRLPKGERAFTYPSILLEKGIETPEAVAYIEERVMGILRRSWFVSIHCLYSHRLYEMGDAGAAQYEPMARALAAYCAHMHDQGVLHLDFSPGNVLWEKDGDTYRFSIVDINRMRFGRVSMADGARSFARLWGPKRFIQLLVREYARLRSFDPQEAEDVLMKERRRFWKHYQKKREMEFPLEL